MPLVPPFELPAPLVSGVASDDSNLLRPCISLSGRTFFLDQNPNEKDVYRRKSASVERQQLDIGEEAGERTLQDGFWRRSQSDFSAGAGQTWMDRPDSNRAMFKSSKGLDPFSSAPALTRLPTTSEVRNSANTDLKLAVTTNGIYLIDGGTLYRSTDAGSTWNAVTGLAGTMVGLASSGNNVYVSTAGAGDTWVVNAGAATAFSTDGADMLGWVKRRLMGTVGNLIYEFTTAGARTLRHTEYESGTTFVGFAEAPGAILVAGNAGGQGFVSRFGVNADGTLTSFATPALAGGLPTDETIYAITCYLGLAFLGTSRGVRICEIDTDGNLTYGPPIPVDTSLAVRCFTPEDSFMYFGWSNYDSTSTGVGRIDLRTFTATLRPAYASDLMVTGQGNVLSIARSAGLLYISVSGDGVYKEQTSLVSSGEVVLGRAQFGTSEEKIAKTVSVVGTGTTTVELSTDGGTDTELGAITGTGSISARSARGADHRVTLTTTGQLDAATVKTLPAVRRQGVRRIPVLIADTIVVDGYELGAPGKAKEDIGFLDDILANGDVVSLTEWVWLGDPETYEVLVEDVDFQGQATRGGMAGRAVLVCRVQ